MGLFFAGLAYSGVAGAAPWPQSDDGFYARTLIAAEALNGLEARRGDIYAEYGLPGQWTVTAKAEAVRFASASYLDRDAYRVSVRRGLMNWKGWQLGAEVAAVYGAASAGLRGCEDSGLEARLGGGLSGVQGGKNFHTFIDVAATAYRDGCENLRAEMGYGADFGVNYFYSQQIWIEQNGQGGVSNKYEAHLGYHFSYADIALGMRESFLSDFDERAFLIIFTKRGTFKRYDAED
jgi:hypothetical protein